jgi:galactokinase/mevalonate kinase-like predicted kinase
MAFTVLLATECIGANNAEVAQPPPHLLSVNADADTDQSASFAHLYGNAKIDAVFDRAAGAESRVLVAVAARHFAWFTQWASARGLPQVALLNTGATAVDGSDQLPTEELLRACLRHAQGPMGVAPDRLFPVSVSVVLDDERATRATIRNDSSDDVKAAAEALRPFLRMLSMQAGPSPATSEAERWLAAWKAGYPSACAAFSYARVGLMGNPSDQLHGKSMAVTIDNFWARVVVTPSPVLEIAQHPIADQARFGSLHDVDSTVGRNGYAGGMRLILAALRRFRLMCLEEKLVPDESALARPFNLKYDTNVPRQVGLAGSSCIVSAVFKALAQFYGVTLNPVTAPNAVLAAEWQELGIHAGLMDRVAQIWGGLVHMDFEKEALTARGGHGAYSRLPLALLPPLYLAYAMDPSDSGKIHSDVKERYFRGDEEVIAASRQWRDIVDRTVEALHNRDHGRFCDLVDENFDLRRKLYGDQCLGHKNLHMIEIARRHASAAKFPGSGGAVLVVPRPAAEEKDISAMREEMQCHGYVLIRLRPTEG